MTTIQLRRGTSQEWVAANPILAPGEVGVELDTNKFKIGDGITYWSVAEYYVPAPDVMAAIQADMASHLAAANPHPQYGSASGLPDHIAAADPHPQYATDADLAAHVAHADPHAQYATDVDLNTHISAPDAHPQYATDADLTAHVAAANPHPAYATDSDLLAHRTDPSAHPQYVSDEEFDAYVKVADVIYEKKSTLLQEAIWHVDAGATKTDRLVDLSGNNRPAVFGAGAAAPVVLPWTGEDYLYIPAVAGNSVSIAMADGLAWTATRLDGTTITGTHTTGTFTFSTAGSWKRIETGNGAYIMDPRNVSADYSTIANTGSAGGNWTIQRAATGYKTVVVDRPLLLMSGNGMYADALMPRINSGTILFAMRGWTDTAIQRHYIAADGVSTGGAYQYRNPSLATVANVIYVGADFGTNAGFWGYGPGQHVFGSVLDGATRFASYLDGKPFNTDTSVTAGAYLIHDRFRIGTKVASLSGEEFLAAAVWDRVLTDAEIAEVSLDLAGVPHDKQPDPHPQYALESQALMQQVTLWADLPTYTTVPLGTRIHVTSGLGVLYALRGPTGWVVDPASDTGARSVTVTAPWTGPMVLRRRGSDVLMQVNVIGSPSLSNPYTLPDGWGTEVNINAPFGSLFRESDQTGAMFWFTSYGAQAVYQAAPGWDVTCRFSASNQWTTASDWPTTAPA